MGRENCGMGEEDRMGSASNWGWKKVGELLDVKIELRIFNFKFYCLVLSEYIEKYS